MFQVKENVYADENGKASHEAGKGRPLILVRGAVISDEQADELGLRELGRALDKAAVKEAEKQNEPLAAARAAKGEAKAEKASGGGATSATASPAASAKTTTGNGGN